MSGRLLKVGGAAAAAGAAYYLYQAGGSPKVAEKQMEHDVAKLSSNVRGTLPGAKDEAKTGIKLSAEQAGQQIDSAIKSAKSEASKVDAKLEEYRKEAGAKFDQYRKDSATEVNKAIDTFDKKVEEGAAKAKSGISSWFGGK